MEKKTNEKLEKFKNIAEFVCFFAGIFVILYVASIILKPKNPEVYDVVALQKVKDLFALEEENTLDVVFVGDSETYATFCPLLMYDDQGFTSYVAGASAQRLCDTYDMVKSIYETQKPKVVVLETDSFFRYAGLITDDGSKYMTYAQKFFPVFKYHTRWKTYFIARLNRQNDFDEQAFQKGFRYRTNIKAYTAGPYMNPTDEVKPFASQVEKYLDLIKEECEKNGSELILVSGPSAICWDYSKHNAVVNYCEKNSLEYFDMNEIDLGIDWLVDTKDGGNHLNYFGAQKASLYFGKYIKKKYDLPDHREDSKYKSWNEDSKTFIEQVENDKKEAV